MQLRIHLCVLFLCLHTCVLSLRPTSSNIKGLEASSSYRRRIDNYMTSILSVPSMKISGKENPVQLLLDGGIGRKFATNIQDEPVMAAVSAMNAMDRGSTLVFDNTGALSGIFTERDFVTKIVDTQKAPSETRISEVMTPLSRMILGSPTMQIGECQQLMVTNKIRHLPIVDSQKNVLGMISMSEMIRVLAAELSERDTARLYGNTLEDVEEQQKDAANEEALKAGSQDALRSGYVIAGAAVLAALLQANWVHDHEVFSMGTIFALGYIGIIFENTFEFHKAAIALLMATALWVIFAGQAGATGITMPDALKDLSEKVSETSEVVFFILGAMTIVEIVDAHKGFKVVTDVINSKTQRGLMWLIAGITFFMSAILDNLTTTILMVSLVKKILTKPDDRKLFGALIVIAANAGGAWTPIGDVTTTMLWINGQISAFPTIQGLFFPSLVSVVISTLILQNEIPEGTILDTSERETTELAPRGKLVFATGVAGLVSVPLFKAATGLPPYLGILASLGVMWTLTDAIHAGDNASLKAPAALSKIDTSGVLFFLGILLSVGALDSAGILKSIAEFLETQIPNENILATAIGLASAVIDNVPLVAATMGMYPTTTTPMDSSLWQLIAFCAGTGGSIFVIGSAAGVALMGLEKVDFLWYAKKISLSAFAGYMGGIAVYTAQQQLFPNTANIINEIAAVATPILNTGITSTF